MKKICTTCCKEGENTMKIPPFTILALAPFSHMADGLSDAEMFAVDTGSLDEAVEKLAATLSIPVPKDLCPSGALTFKPSRMKDFRPEGVVRTIPFLKDLSDASEAMDRMAFEGRPAEEIAQYISVQWPGLSLNLAITENRTPKLINCCPISRAANPIKQKNRVVISLQNTESTLRFAMVILCVK